MKKLIGTCILMAGMLNNTFAKDGYKIQIKFNGITDSTLYLAHYFAQPLPKIYKTDSAQLDKSGLTLLKSDKKITGGMYIIMLSDRKTYFEFLLNNGDNIEINVSDVNKLPGSGITIKNSPENQDFFEYEHFVKKVGEEHQALQKKLADAKNSVDSTAIKEQMAAKMKSLVKYRNDYCEKKPGSFLSKIFNGLDLPNVPEGKHLLPSGEEDKEFAYKYYKSHYWDKFDLSEERLINTPLYDARLAEYFEKLVIPVPDSVIKEANWILKKTENAGDLFNYTLSWLANFSQDSKVMGMDEVYVYLVDNYYEKGKAAWLSNELLQKHINYKNEISPTLIGKLGYNLVLKDTSNKEVDVSKIKSKYKLLVFWEPSCGHCMKEIPALDSTFKADKLDKKGVKMFGILTQDLVPSWKEFIRKNKLGDWVHLHDPERKSLYKSRYNVMSSPTIFLLDEKGIIRGKKIDHTNITELVNMLDRMEEDRKKQQSK